MDLNVKNKRNSGRKINGSTHVNVMVWIGIFLWKV